MSRYTSSVILMFLILSYLPGCATSKPEKSQLEIREMQTRTFRTTKKKQVMQAVTGALLDDGYIIKQTNNELGVINGKKKQTHSSFGNDRQEIYALTAQVRTRNGRTQVRLNIQKTIASTQQKSFLQGGKIISGTRAQEHSTRVKNPKVYRRLFNKIDKSLFIEEEVYKKQKTQAGKENGNSDTGADAPSDENGTNEEANQTSDKQERQSDPDNE